MNVKDYVQRERYKIGGWCTDLKQEWLMNTILENDIETVVEVGVYQGKSCLAMASALKAKKRGIIYAIDAYDLDLATENGMSIEAQFHEDDIESIFKDHIKRLKVTKYINFPGPRSSEQAVTQFEDGFADMIHIDANHSEESSMADLMRWFPKLKTGGVLVLDDTNWPTVQKAKARAIDQCSEVLIEAPEWMGFKK